MPKTRQKTPSYHAAIDDIRRARKLRAGDMRRIAEFLVAYYGCEKLAKAIVGINARRGVRRAMNDKPSASEIEKAANELGIVFPRTPDWFKIFGNKADTTARKLRDKLVHELGPGYLKKALGRYPTLMPMMEGFLVWLPQVLKLPQVVATRRR